MTKQEKEIAKMRKEIDDLKSKLSECQENERVMLIAAEKDEETVRKLFEVVGILTKGATEMLKQGVGA